MTIFGDTAEALGVAPEARNRAWGAVGALNLSPDDPECVRILINEHMRATIEGLVADLDLSASKAIRDFGNAQSQAEGAAQAWLTARNTELAQTLATGIAQNIEQILERRTESKRVIAISTQWLTGVVLFGLGVWTGATASGWLAWSAMPTGRVSLLLRSYNPWVLLAAGAAGFMILRLGVAWTATSPLIRWLLALPPLDDVRRWRRSDY